MLKEIELNEVHEVVVHGHFYFRSKEEAFNFMASNSAIDDVSYNSFKTSDEVSFYSDLVQMNGEDKNEK